MNTNQGNKNPAGVIFTILLSALTAAALCMDMAIPDLHTVPLVERTTLFTMPELLWNVYGSIQWKAFLPLAVAVFLFARLVGRVSKRSFAFLIPAAIEAIFFLTAECFCQEDQLGMLISRGGGQEVKSGIYFIGMTYGFYLLIQFLYFLLDRYNQEYEKKFYFWKTFGIILLFWLPHLFLNFPGAIVSDTWGQLAQFFGEAGWSSHHPPFSTLIMGAVMSSARLLGGNTAVFLYALLQAVLFALILSYLFKLFAYWRISKWVRIMMWICVVTVPYYTNYITVMVKDTIYSYCALLFVIEIIYIKMLGMNYVTDWKHVLLWLVSVSGTLLFRNNGKYIVYPTMLIMLFSMFAHGRKNRNFAFKKYIVAIMMLFLPVVLSSIISFSMEVQLGIEKGSIREALSLPMQQTARYVTYHGDEVTEEEEAAIRAVLDYDHLVENYNPRVSDPVKSTFLYETDMEKLTQYFKVWIRQGLKHPGTYLAATMNQNYYLFYPFVPNNIVYVGLDGLGGMSGAGNGVSYENASLARELNIHNIDALSPVRKLLFALYQAYFYLPGTGFLTHPAFWTILLICLFIFVCRKRIFNWMLPAFPIFLSVFVVIAAPGIQRHPRYTFPIVFTVPVLLGYYLYLSRERAEVTE